MTARLRPATEPEKLERDLVTFAEWGTSLTLEQYLEREAVLRAHPFSKGMTTWLLADGNDVLASCETYANVSRLGGERGVSHSVASVYVEERLRGRGYATQLMDALSAELSGQAVVLFSDVGERLYARSGYVAVPSVDWVLEPKEGARSHAELEVPASSEPEPGVLQLEPTLEQLDWAHARERLYAKFHGRMQPASHAAAAGAARACWAAYFKSNELIVLWLQPGAPDETSAVLDAARAEAFACGLKRVRLWAVEGVAALPEVSVLERKEEVPMVRSLGVTPIVSWRHVQRALWV